MTPKENKLLTIALKYVLNVSGNQKVVKSRFFLREKQIKEKDIWHI
ncbi:MAG: hypothetical protein IPN86_21330 [Saprospiraceae bacterium]|nr:hypothetical protein [Saprospiraceae bacterium]